MDVERGGGHHDKGSTNPLKKWVVWLFGILLIAAIFLAVVLSVSLNSKTERFVERIVERVVEVEVEVEKIVEVEVEVERIVEVEVEKIVEVRRLVPSHDVLSTSTPFDRFQVSDAVRQRFAGLTDDEKIGQVSQWSHGDASGPPIDGNEEDNWRSLIENSQVGSFLNVVDLDRIAEYQALAAEHSTLPIIFAYDTIHGFNTIFPVNIGLAASFDRQLIYDTSVIAARETRGAGITWTFAPMLDISRDPRWGRISESFGEDPYLTGELGAKMVEGFQDNGVAACVKHFAAYGAAQAGRDYHTAQLGTAYLHNDYLPAYKKAFDAGAYTAMASFNTIDGVPSHSNRVLLTDILRGMWGWDGLVVGDYNGIAELIPHRVSASASHGAQLAMSAGLDMSMADGHFMRGLPDVMDNEVADHAIRDYVDVAVQRILAIKEKLDLFENPTPDASPFCTEEYRDKAREAAERSMVLLKNADNTLPIPDTSQNVLIVGSLADSPVDMLGSWHGQGMYFECGSRIVTFKAGLEAVWADGDGSFTYVNDTEHPTGAVDHLQSNDVDYIIYVAGETEIMNGEAASRTNLDVPELALIKELHAVNAEKETPAKFVLVLNGGRPMTVEWEDANLDAILMAWSAGTMAGDALANILLGRVTPAGKMPATTPRNVGQIPLYYSQLNTGRPCGDRCENEVWTGEDRWFVSHYIDSKNSPLYPFGYGLSYTTFTYSDLAISSETESASAGGSITVSATITNNNPTISADEIVQLYVRDLLSDISPPQKRLKGFERISFAAGDAAPRTVTFTLNIREDLGFYDNSLEWVVEPGDFEIMIAPNSDDESLKTFFVLDV